METQRTPEKPDQDSLEMAWMKNGDVENRYFELQCASTEGCMHLVGVLEEDDVSQSPRSLSNFGDHQDSSPFQDDTIDEKIQSLQELIPDSIETDKASMLDEAIEYIQGLQRQLQMISMNLPSMVLPPRIQCLQMPRMPQMAMNMDVGIGMMDMGATGSGQGLIPVTSATGPAVPHNMSVAGMMMEADDPHMDPRNSYLAHQEAMQIQQQQRDRMNEKRQSLQELILSSNETDKASMLDEAIEYIQVLQRQLQMISMRSGMNLPPMVLPSGIQCLQMPQMPQMAMNMGVGMGTGMGMGLGMGMVDMGATGSGQGLIPVTSATGSAVPHNMSVPGTMMEVHDPHMDPHNSYLAHQDQAMQIQQRCNVEQLGMVHQSSSKGNMEVMNYGVNENGDHYLSGMREAQVEDMDSEPENASEGYQPDGADDTFIFQATSLNSVNTQVFKERILTAICDLNDRTFGQNSKLQVNVLQCKYMVNTIVTSKCYLRGETCATLGDPIYKELFRIVKKADLIVQECSDEPLNLKSILVEMDNICAFVAVIVDWQSCTRLFRKDIDNWTWASVHSRLEQLKAQDIQKNKELWDPHIAELRQLMSNAGGSRTGERINLADYLQWRVQNVMNAYDLPQGLLPWCDLASDPEAKRGEFLGMGTFGSVSQYTWFGMTCAEKSFNPFLCEKQERDFENEVGVMIRLNHPHVVRLICCHQDSTKCSIVMELMPTNLERHIAERKVSHKPFTPQAAVDVMSQIASGMEYLHGQGVVHRDLKPNNILVSPNTNPELSADGYVEVKLADFGLAKTKVNSSSSMLHSQICGAAPWRAPEAFEDHKGHRRRFSAKKADVYSFAILCSQILSGKLHPFGYPPVGLLERISSPKYERPFLPLNSNYPAQLLSLIKQCWDPDPHIRPNFSTICSSLQEIRLSLLACKWDVN